MNVIYKIGQAIKDIQDKMDLMEDGESIDWYIEGNDLVILVDTGEYRYVLASVNVKNGHLEDGGQIKDLVEKYEQRKSSNYNVYGGSGSSDRPRLSEK
jgi:hypothetical protein